MASIRPWNCFNGATHRSAWRGTLPIASAFRRPGFNGATHRSAWRVVSLSPTSPVALLASTEPRTEVRGENRTLAGLEARNGLQRSHAPKCVESIQTFPKGAKNFPSFNGATHRSAWRGRPRWWSFPASRRLQRSHAPKCVERMEEALSYKGRSLLLQRSHAPKCVESCDCGMNAHVLLYASTEPRTEVRGELAEFGSSLTSTSLQRSHAPKCVERLGKAIRMLADEAASTEPRTEVRGELEHLENIHFKRVSFNGATHRSAWRGQHHDCKRSANKLASTEPRTEVRGESSTIAWKIIIDSRFNGATHRSAWRGADDKPDLPALALLQRSHAPKCVESRHLDGGTWAQGTASTEPRTEVRGELSHSFL